MTLALQVYGLSQLAGLARQLEELCRELARMPTVADRGEGGRPTYGFSRLRTAGKSR